ncbi:MAG: leucine-rich repeat domain-containing protein [Dehalococcoidia bacterium]|nr:MAG: leucine-rich repeat domain-containing protein [Dehalococcoidia bacterium]
MKRFKIFAVVISPLILIALIVGCPSSDELIADNNLEATVRDTLDLLLGERVTTDHLANLTLLSANDSNITNLSGLEYCINLVEADFSNNIIGDISPVIFLDNLVTLNMWNNQISQIPAACTFSSLVNLNLSGNQIEDISPLASVLNLANLSISGNRLTDISPLESLLNLTRLNLSGNQISDISPLLENSGLGEGDVVNLEGNELDLTEGSEDIASIRLLESRGVEITY